MFSVIFEVHPKPEQWDAYLGYAKMLRPELEQIEGFVDNIRYRSLIREGWILSLSGWRDEKAVVRWRTKVNHHEIQEKGRPGSPTAMSCTNRDWTRRRRAKEPRLDCRDRRSH